MPDLPGRQILHLSCLSTPKSTLFKLSTLKSAPGKQYYVNLSSPQVFLAFLKLSSILAIPRPIQNKPERCPEDIPPWAYSSTYGLASYVRGTPETDSNFLHTIHKPGVKRMTLGLFHFCPKSAIIQSAKGRQLMMTMWYSPSRAGRKSRYRE